MRTSDIRRRALSRLVLATLLVALGTGCAKRASQDELWIIGLDGADWDILDPMIEAGELPHLAALRAEGAYGRLRSDEPMLSPIIWTSLATGKTADKHGITWFMTDGPDSEKIPVSSRNRRVRALWNILSERDLSVGFIGWWATWPVEPVNGFLVSDYVGWHSFGITGKQLEVPGKVWPPEWQKWVVAEMPNPQTYDSKFLQTFVHMSADQLALDESEGPYSDPLQHLRQAVATARGYTDIALDALDRERPRLLGIYYEGTDGVEHLFGQYMPPQQEWVSDEEFQSFGDVVRNYWGYQDSLIGELLAKRTDHTTVLVISDHGFRQGSERLREYRFEIDRADASHMIDGIVLLAGPGIPAGQKIHGASVYDITPTVLDLVGLPVAEDMVGKVLSVAPPSGKDPIPTYETGPWDRGADVVVDPESGKQMEEMLRSLGYISSSSSESDDPSAPADAGMSAENAVNLAVVYQRQGHYDKAIAVLNDVLRENPEHFGARGTLAQVEAKSGDYEAAKKIYKELLQNDSENLELIEGYGLTLGRSGDNEKAVAVFADAVKRHPDWALGWARLSFARLGVGDREGAQEAIRRSLAEDESSATAHYYQGVLQASAGKLEAAKSSFGRALELDPSYEDALVDLVGAERRSGELDQALDRLQRFQDRNGPTKAVLSELGAVYLEMGKAKEALTPLQEASSKFPRDGVILSNLGMAQAITGDIQSARRSFERLLQIEPNSADAHTKMGNLQAQLGNLTAAMREWKKAIECDPHAVEPAMSLATLYHRQKRLQDAIDIYERVVKEDPNNAQAWYQMAMAVGASGNDARARELLARARKLDPSLPVPGRRQ